MKFKRLFITSIALMACSSLAMLGSLIGYSAGTDMFYNTVLTVSLIALIVGLFGAVFFSFKKDE
ncbi:MAG TPA: hypothetical protein DEF61_02705 [Firmicutes bacterium]|nr:hypothetical protein [Bacillota bacterium]HBX25173.1 hypothetical protein [Bacillota bacterium]